MEGKGEQKNLISKEPFTNQGKVEEFEQWLCAQGYSKRTIRNYLEVVKSFIKANISDQEGLNRWLEGKKRTYHRAALAHYFKFVGIELKVPKLIREPASKPKPQLSWEHLNEVVERLKRKSAELYYIYKIMLLTGARIHEVLNLKFCDIDVENSAILLKTKGGKYRKARLPQSFMKDLFSYFTEKKGLLSQDYCFFTRWKRETTEILFWRELRKVLNKKEYRILKNTHACRRAVINKIIQEAGILAAKEFVGHAKVDTTMRYLLELTKEKEIKKAYKVMGIGGD